MDAHDDVEGTKHTWFRGQHLGDGGYGVVHRWDLEDEDGNKIDVSRHAASAYSYPNLK
jgi:hypothetical protein